MAWNGEIEQLKSAVSKSGSITDVIKALGYKTGNAILRNRLKNAISENNVDINHFRIQKDRWNNLSIKLSQCDSVADVLKLVGLTDKGDNFRTAKKRLKELGFSLDNFSGGPKGNAKPKLSVDSIFQKESSVARSTVRHWIRKLKLIDDSICSNCGTSKSWQQGQLSMELDHIDGDPSNNELTNLRFLCPNCHSLTPTHRGKKRIRV